MRLRYNCHELGPCHIIQPVAEFTEPRTVPLPLAEPMEQRVQSQTCLSFVKSRQRKTIGQGYNGESHLCLERLLIGHRPYFYLITILPLM